ncbi:cobyrinate a,c-diamide synthase [Candidatus Thiothrix sp. Deng01]|uniref:Cobyrinate a,c-diamide synthase n=1 Tax=Candidatus Thiothrix phosphatis TaxID=3112415 RepID=A0ABU6CVG0_9GAMM|nr:cobyrinate a,c-diamide synthase [Candidatus Thiothrix sp. Deng01]MEB4590062.1 cobyrinate a,c-diamide synthase [Candidatus Thiothrix sp. Deng01]
MARVFISATHKSSGKTTLSIGLCAALRAQGLAVQPFKKGPDYIDPLWLGAASGRACHNLDFNTMTADEILHTLQHYARDADVALIEANKGLYDGMALDGSDSNAAVARLTRSPVVLVVDTRGMTRGVAPLLLGYQQFDTQLAIAGIIFNRVGGARHAAKLRESVEYYTDIKVLGAVHNNPAMEIEERHLGLMPSNESGEAEAQIARIRALVEEQVDLALLRAIAGRAEALPAARVETRAETPAPDIRIAICQDPSFGFYYPGDLEALQQAGAELVPVNTLQDAALPTGIDGLFIGGGFPETHMRQLAANGPMRASIRAAIDNGLPTYAECGGLMYLSRRLVWDGQQAEMVGVIPGDAVMHRKPQGRGYVKVQETADMPWPGGGSAKTINAHEFHYSRLENLTASGKFAYRIQRGAGIDGQHDGWIYRNLLASYTHMRDTSQYRWAQRFVEFIRQQKRKPAS